MNIFKTFELFLREPLSILKNGIIQIVNVNSELITSSNIDVQMIENKAQITVINNEKVYNLLKTVQYKQKTLAAKNLIKASEKKQIVIGKLLGRA